MSQSGNEGYLQTYLPPSFPELVRLRRSSRFHQRLRFCEIVAAEPLALSDSIESQGRVRHLFLEEWTSPPLSCRA